MDKEVKYCLMQLRAINDPKASIVINDKSGSRPQTVNDLKKANYGVINRLWNIL